MLWIQLICFDNYSPGQFPPFLPSAGLLPGSLSPDDMVEGADLRVRLGAQQAESALGQYLLASGAREQVCSFPPTCWAAVTFSVCLRQRIGVASGLI